MDHMVNPSAHDDAEHDQAYQITPCFIPPGAEIPYPHPSLPLQRAESFLQTSFEQCTTEMPISTLPSYSYVPYYQGEGSDPTPYGPGFLNQTMSLSYSIPEHGQQMSSHKFRLRPTSGPGSNIHRSRPSAHHSRVLSQPYLQHPRLAAPSGGRGPLFADPCAGPSRLTPAISNLKSETIQPGPSLAPQSGNFVTHSITHSQAPDPVAPSLPRRYSEADIPYGKNVFLDPQAYVNPHTSGPINTVQETSPHTQDGPAIDVDYSFPPSPSYESLDDSSSVTSLFESASPGPSGGAGHVVQQGTTSSSQQRRRRLGERKRAANPKDKKAADRLRNQRGMDDSCIETLYRLFVSRNAHMVPKKDRLETIVRFATHYVETFGPPEQSLSSTGHETDRLPPQGRDTRNEYPQLPGTAE